MATAEVLPLKAEFEYYLQHRDELFQQYGLKYVVIKDGKVNRDSKDSKEIRATKATRDGKDLRDGRASKAGVGL